MYGQIELMLFQKRVQQLQICLTDLSSCPSWQLLFFFCLLCAIIPKTARKEDGQCPTTENTTSVSAFCF